jgi:hypothetical protein
MFGQSWGERSVWSRAFRVNGLWEACRRALCLDFSSHMLQSRKGAERSMLVNLFAGTLTVMFLIGLAGCLIVIPITAYRLFSILFERDVPEDEN